MGSCPPRAGHKVREAQGCGPAASQMSSGQISGRSVAVNILALEARDRGFDSLHLDQDFDQRMYRIQAKAESWVPVG